MQTGSVFEAGEGVRDVLLQALPAGRLVVVHVPDLGSGGWIGGLWVADFFVGFPVYSLAFAGAVVGFVALGAALEVRCFGGRLSGEAKVSVMRGGVGEYVFTFAQIAQAGSAMVVLVSHCGYRKRDEWIEGRSMKG